MKKILLGSTALLLSAGVAAAEVRVVGDGRMGVVYQNRAAVGAPDITTGKMVFSQRMRVTFLASGETDTGLTFGGWARFQVGNNTTITYNFIRSSDNQHVFIAGAFGRLAMGDVEGAVKRAVGDLHEVGYQGLGFNNENAFLQDNFGPGLAAATGPDVLYSYTVGDLELYASLSQIAPDTVNRTYGVGAAYTFGNFRVGAGVEQFDSPLPNSDFTHIGLAASGTFSNIEVRATYGRVGNNAGTASRDQYGISASADFDPITVLGYARRDFADVTHVGIGGAYDLGGGAVVRGGIVRSSASGLSSRTTADLGINLSF